MRTFISTLLLGTGLLAHSPSSSDMPHLPAAPAAAPPPLDTTPRITGIEGLVRNLRAAGAEMLDTIAVYDYGKFVHLLDPQGHKIELWELVDSVLTALGSPTNK